MHILERNGQGYFTILWILLLATIAIIFVIDVALDDPDQVGTLHFVVESAIIFVSLGSAAALGLSWIQTQRRMAELKQSLKTERTERDQWRKRAESLLHGLGTEIDAQLEIWGLTPVERETVLLLLKGYGHKEIAHLLKKSERTVRHQAAAVYRKSHLAGRAELAAFFLEHLMLPQKVDAEASEAGDTASPPEETEKDRLARVS
jgi:DNA-binding CsgD family transcriptional regulator